MVAMDRKKITISDEGIIAVPNSPDRVRMTVCEITALLGIYYPTAKRHIRAIEKSGIADGDYSMTCIAEGMGVTQSFTASK
jgi:DNA-binding transcriptional ArsR family regulator